MERQGEHPPSVLGRSALGVERAEALQELASLLQRPWGWAVGEAQPVRRRAPGGEFERETREVDLGDLGLEVRPPRAVLELAPEPVGDARFGTPGASGALIGGRSARADRGETGHPGALVESWDSGQAGVDHDANTVDRQRRLGDVGAQHDAATTMGRRFEREVLLGECQRAGERPHVDVGRERALEHRLHPPDLTDPRQEHEHVAGLLAHGPVHERGHRLGDTVLLAHGRPHDLDRVHPSVAAGDRCVGA